jgi:hypothetical protein
MAARPAQHTTLGEIFEQGRRLNSEQPSDRDAAVRDDYFLPGAGAIDPA